MWSLLSFPCHGCNAGLDYIQSDERTVALVIMTSMTSWQGLAERRQRRAPDRRRGCTPGSARRQTRTGCRVESARTTRCWWLVARGRGGYERKVRAGCRRLELCPGQAEAPSAVGEIDTKEAERHGNLFNFCQSRREEDNSQTGMM